MRIGINCLNISPDYVGGVNSYTLGLIEGWTKIQSDHDFVIFATAENRHLFERFARTRRFTIKQFDGYDNIWKKRIMWRLAIYRLRTLFSIADALFYRQLARTTDSLVDLIYFPNTILFPLRNTKCKVLSMHDIQQFHYPEFFSRLELNYRCVKYMLSARRTDYMQASSEFMKRDFLEHFRFLKPEQLFVVNEGVDIETFQNRQTGTGVREKYDLPEHFLFYPAQLWHHKNHITVLKALLKLKKECSLNIPLVLTGTEYGAAESIFQFIDKNEMRQVSYLGRVPFEDLISLYQEARFLITAVLYESNSLPILEAAAAGTPIIASDTPPNRELTGRLRINLFPPLDADKLAELLYLIWNDEDLIKLQTQTNAKGIEFYSWQRAAAKYIEVFETLIGAAEQVNRSETSDRLSLA